MAVGQSISMVDSQLRVTGGIDYTLNFELPRMLHACVLHSPHAHARILNIDTSKAEKLPGVAAVLTREGVDATAQKALLIRDPTRVYAAIRGEATAFEAAFDKSANNAKTILDILASDPTVAGWLYAQYVQAIQYAQVTQWNALGYVATASPATGT